MKTLVITLLGLVAMLAGYDLPAQAAQPHRQQTVRYFNWLPPVEYDKPYTGELEIVRIATEEEIYNICKGSSRAACAAWGGAGKPAAKCIIFMLPDKQLKAMHHGPGDALSLRHELGHCNGWPGDHPNKRKVFMDTHIAMPTMPAVVKELPLSPPVVCVTPDWKQEPCKDRAQTVTATQ